MTKEYGCRMDALVSSPTVVPMLFVFDYDREEEIFRIQSMPTEYYIVRYARGKLG